MTIQMFRIDPDELVHQRARNVRSGTMDAALCDFDGSPMQGRFSEADELPTCAPCREWLWTNGLITDRERLVAELFERSQVA